jgi:hypothetical protein
MGLVQNFRPVDVANALDMLLHMLKVVSEGKPLDQGDIAEMKQLIRHIEASR